MHSLAGHNRFPRLGANATWEAVNEHLDVFGGLRGCSLACEAFLASAPKSASTRIFGSLKRLTASLSPPHKAATEHPSETVTTEAEAPAQNRHRDRFLQDILHVLP